MSVKPKIRIKHTFDSQGLIDKSLEIIKIMKDNNDINLIKHFKETTTQTKTTEQTNTDEEFFSLPPISSEQKFIVDLVKNGYNVTVDAVAGSGKTTTSLHTALNNSDKSILLLTYNAKLKFETRQKVKNLNLDNIEVHSYHSFCVKYLFRKSYTDSGIITFLKTKDYTSTLKPFAYDIIIVDEAQDVNPTYYKVVQHILKRLTAQPQFVIMGDRKQAIYAFNKADYRFLTLSNELFTNNIQWKSATLNTSYRITIQMADFINNCCKGTLPLNSIKQGPKVKYIICDTFGQTPYREVMNAIKNGYDNDEIFILTPSVKSENSPVRRLANQLTNHGISIYVPTTDEEKLDEEVLKGKIVFSTFHQVKGLERPYVIVYNFDNSYYKYYAKDIPPTEFSQIPNTIYVAITRAQKQLVVLHDKKYNYFEFLKQSNLRYNCYLTACNDFNPIKNISTPSMRVKQLSVTELVKYVPVDIIDKCMEYINVTKKTDNKSKIDIPIKVKQSDLYEGVSEITGVALPSYYEYKILGKMTIYQYLQKNKMSEISSFLNGKTCLLDDENNTYHNLYSKITTNINIGEPLLQLSTEWVCSKSGYDFKKKQIKSYDWLSSDILDKTVERLNVIFTPETHKHLEFEKPLITQYDGFMLTGFADMYNGMTGDLWELKVVNTIDNILFLQVIIYCWMIIKSGGNVNSINLFNILTNIAYTLTIDMNNLENIVNILIEHKKFGLKQQSDIEFLQAVKNN